uniref:Uncharacterized protein n=1 Tax=Anopheles quadriannulatus TaxID=34691 RepID=A0A182XS67_ANOQN
ALVSLWSAAWTRASFRGKKQRYLAPGLALPKSCDVLAVGVLHRACSSSPIPLIG